MSILWAYNEIAFLVSFPSDVGPLMRIKNVLADIAGTRWTWALILFIEHAFMVEATSSKSKY